MLPERTPMTVETLRRLMSARLNRAHVDQRRNERRADRSRMGLAIGMVMANRRAADWDGSTRTQVVSRDIPSQSDRPRLLRKHRGRAGPVGVAGRRSLVLRQIAVDICAI